ncbi:MAG TPA: hypothetical protein VNI77_09105 [Nitrososphaera sp.]|nr:hypothetical protein [Nitrososphaera sp.]
MFKERKTRFALLSLLSALAVASNALTGVSIYAENADDGELTATTEAKASEEKSKDSTDPDNKDVVSLLEGLIVCNVGEVEISGETRTASSYLEETDGSKPTISITVMPEAEVAALADKDTERAASEDDKASSAAPPAKCVRLGEDQEDDNTTTANSVASSENESGKTSASARDSDRQILLIEGQNFVPGEVVLMFIENELRGIDDVNDSGEIEAKIPVPERSETTVAGIGDPMELRFVESGTQRTGNLEFDGETLIAHDGSDIEVAVD